MIITKYYTTVNDNIEELVLFNNMSKMNSLKDHLKFFTFLHFLFFLNDNNTLL